MRDHQVWRDPSTNRYCFKWKGKGIVLLPMPTQLFLADLEIRKERTKQYVQSKKQENMVEHVTFPSAGVSCSPIATCCT